MGEEGDVLNITIGAGGKEKWGTESKEQSFTHGNDGGDSIVSLNGMVKLKAVGGRAGGCCSYMPPTWGRKNLRLPAQGGAGWSGGGNQGFFGEPGSDGGSDGRNGGKSYPPPDFILKKYPKYIIFPGGSKDGGRGQGT